MAGNRWMLAGCGGCLTIILVGLIAGVYGLYWMTHHFNEWVNDMEKLQIQLETLNQKYSFTTPENIDPQRYRIFLQVREETIELATEELDWFYSFVQGRDQKERISFFRFISNLITLVPTLGKIGIEQCEALDQVQMSAQEFRFYTAISAGETLVWLEMNDQPERRKLAQSYWSWMNHMNQAIEKQQHKDIPANVDVGPFEQDDFKRRIESIYPTDQSYSELLWRYRDEFFAPRFGVFMDAFTLSELFNAKSND